MVDAVDAFRQISWLILKWISWAILSVIVLCVIIGGGAYFYNWYTYDRHVQNVSILVSTSKDKQCDDDNFPIRVAIINKSERVIERVAFDLAARVPNRSTDITKSHDYKDDQIIEPGTGWATCWASPGLTGPVSDVRSLNWSIKYKSITFRD